MNTTFCFFALLGALLAVPKAAMATESSPLQIVTDIPFVTSLVSDIAGENDQVTGLLSSAGSPHDFALRPRAMRSVQQADLLVSIGPALMPSISSAMTNTGKTKSLNLSQLQKLEMLTFDSFSDSHAEKHVASLAENVHDHDRGIDPHIWTDPKNVQVMTNAIRDALVALDPTRTEQFTHNANEVFNKLEQFHDAQTLRWNSTSVPFVTLHDNIQYFTHRYGLKSSGNLLIGDHAPPSAKHLKTLQNTLRSNGITCIVSDPNTNPRWTRTLTEGVDVSVVVVDVVGTSQENPHYLTLLTQLSDALIDCGR